MLFLIRTIKTAKWKLLPRGLLTGIAIGGFSYIASYDAEILIAMAQSKSPSLQFYTSSYNVLGNTAMSGGMLFILISIVGNIINTTTKAEPTNSAVSLIRTLRRGC